MNQSRIAEFLVVLLFAAVMGGLLVLAVTYLSGTQLMVAIIVLAMITIASWNFLRKRFGRR